MAGMRNVPLVLINSLADAVLGQEPVKLALAVMEGGEHCLDRALDLARLVLSQPQSSTQSHQVAAPLAKLQAGS